MLLAPWVRPLWVITESRRQISSGIGRVLPLSLGYALGLAYPFIMKGLYGGGLFGSSSSLACSPTFAGMQGSVFGNPFLAQQMQQHYMQQMFLMQAYYSSMPGMMGGVAGGMIPGGMMGGVIGGMIPGGMMGGVIGGMIPGGMMGGVIGGMIPGGMMGGMMPGGMMGGMMPGMMGGMMMPGGMMPGGMMGGMMPGMMGGMMMPGGMMPGGMMGGMMPGMMGGMMPGMMGGGGMQAYIQYQQAMMAYQQAMMNNYMQRQQAASGLYSEIVRLQMQIQQILYGGGSGGNYQPLPSHCSLFVIPLPPECNPGHVDTGGGGDDNDDNDEGVRGI